MTIKEQYIIDHIDNITVQVRYPYRGSGFRQIWFSLINGTPKDYEQLSQRVAARMYNREIIIHKKKISGDTVMLGTYTLQLNPRNLIN